MGKCYRAELVGAFGCPIDENPTGVLEEAGFRAAGLNYRYLTIKVNDGDLKAAMEAVKVFNMKGINLTIPHKVKVLEYLDELSPAAEIIGAVNTVINKDGKLYGENTDGKGFIKSLSDEGVLCDGKMITILGAGGAARAIAVECALNGAEHINIINRSSERGTELAHLIEGKTPAKADYIPWTENIPVPNGTDILINATNIGLYPNVTDAPSIDYDTIADTMVVSDVVFNPPQTPFLQNAAQKGAKTITGLGMLVNQGALNFTLWTGEDAPYDIMYQALRAEF